MFSSYLTPVEVRTMAKKNGKASKNSVATPTLSAQAQVPKPIPKPRPLKKSAGKITLPPISSGDAPPSNLDNPDPLATQSANNSDPLATRSANNPDPLAPQSANIPPQSVPTSPSAGTTASTPVLNNPPPIGLSGEDPDPLSAQSANDALQSVATNTTTSALSQAPNTRPSASAETINSAQMSNKDANLAAQLATALGEPFFS